MATFAHNMRVRFRNGEVGVLKSVGGGAGFTVVFEFNEHTVTGRTVFTPEELDKHGAEPHGERRKRAVSSKQAAALAKGRAALEEKRREHAPAPTPRRQHEARVEAHRAITTTGRYARADTGGTMGKKKKKRSKRAKPTAKSRPHGKTTGLTIQGAWVDIFERNARAKKSKRLTDAEIEAHMVAEFPGYDSVVFHKVQIVRCRYNRGGLTKGEVPKAQSVRYDADGNVDRPKRGRPVGSTKKAKAPKRKVRRR